MLKWLYLILTIITLTSCSAADSSQSLQHLTLPPGYKIEIFADHLPGARTLALSDAGVIFVGTKDENVYALIPPKNPQEKMRTITLLSGLNRPNGVAYYKGDLYVAEIHRILKYKDIDKHLDNPPKPVIVNEDLPREKWHGARVIKIGPDEKIYVAIGMPCNTCNHRNDNPLFGTISSMTLDGKNLQPYAIGLRNSVGFDWHPETKELWFTDNGQDLLGPNIPPEEINRASQASQDFGFPFVYGDNILAPDYNNENIKGLTFTIPAFQIQAHSAPLGMIFYQPNQILVALHGSWNRLEKVGYEIVQLNVKDNRVVSMQPFIKGWLKNGDVLGRPVDFLRMPDTSLLITDDHNGLIYRVIPQSIE